MIDHRARNAAWRSLRSIITRLVAKKKAPQRLDARLRLKPVDATRNLKKKNELNKI